jgi:succinate dehydrogenase / fumarate reductase cytochrome b subunit
VGKKYLTGFTGLALFLFLVVHLLGNLTLYMGPHALNHYAHFLEHALHGMLVYAFEAGLILLLLIHITASVAVALFDKNRARPVKYKKSKNAGGESRKTFSSTTMIYTGLLLLLFIVLHVKMFKYGGARIITLPDGTQMKDLYAVVLTAFKDLRITMAYVLMMLLLGFHLRHGFWSAFQSMGWNNRRWMPLLYSLGLVLAILLALGFLMPPLYLYFFVDPVTTGGH